MKPVTVLIIDDSLTIRTLIRARLSGDPRIQVVGEAEDPIDARAKIKALNPDVITLDVEMPRMNGLDFLDRLMRLRPMPVVMISTETHRGMDAAIEALSLGAVACIGKPAPDRLGEAFSNLAETILQAAEARPRAAGPRATTPLRGFDWNGRCILIGASTGGVDALEVLLSGFPENCPPTLITQHMPGGFLEKFAARLDRKILPRLSLARQGDTLRQGQIYLAPGGETHLALSFRGSPACHLVASEPRGGHRPSVDVLFSSALPMADRAVAVLLTGMGRDGAEGMAALRRGGAKCLAQDAESCVVFGMPRVALETGAAEAAVSLRDMAPTLLAHCARGPAAGRS